MTHIMTLCDAPPPLTWLDCAAFLACHIVGSALPKTRNTLRDVLAEFESSNQRVLSIKIPSDLNANVVANLNVSVD